MVAPTTGRRSASCRPTARPNPNVQGVPPDGTTATSDEVSRSWTVGLCRGTGEQPIRTGLTSGQPIRTGSYGTTATLADVSSPGRSDCAVGRENSRSGPARRQDSRSGRARRQNSRRGPVLGPEFVGAESVENVPPQLVAGRDPGMIEVLGRVAVHPDPLHDPDGSLVEHRGPREDLGQSGDLETVPKRLPGSFRCVTLAPRLRSEPPADLGGRRERGFECVNQEAREAKKARRVPALHHPQTVPMLREPSLDSPHEVLGLVATQRTGEIVHYLGVRVHRGEGFEVCLAPRPEDEPLGGQRRSDPERHRRRVPVKAEERHT
jgi:hypothetical protein